MSRITDLKKERAGLIEGTLRTLVNRASDEKRDLTVEERATYDRVFSEAQAKLEQIRMLEQQEELENSLLAEQRERERENNPKPVPAGTMTYDIAFREWMTSTTGSVSPEARAALDKDHPQTRHQLDENA